MNSNGSSARATSFSDSDRRARLGAGQVGRRIAQPHLAHDPVRKAELAVRAGADAEVVAELPVVEVVARAVAGARIGRDLVALEAGRGRGLA